MKKNVINICIIASAIIATLIISVRLKSIFFFIWLVIPYVVTGLISTKYSYTPVENILSYFALLFISIGGLYFIIDVIYLHPDPQGGIALFMLPPIQIVAYGIIVSLYSVYNNFTLK